MSKLISYAHRSNAQKIIKNGSNLPNTTNFRLSWFHKHEPGTKARLSFSGGPHAPVNMANSMEEVNVGGNKNPQEMTRLLRCTALHFVSQVFANP